MRQSAFIAVCLLVVVAFVVVPRWVRPFPVGMSEQRVTTLLTNRSRFLLRPDWIRDDERCIFWVRRRFLVAEQDIWMRFQRGGAVTNVMTKWNWRL
jgi:hypothetical protein